MTLPTPKRPTGQLLPHLRWFIQLRWLAGLAVVAGSFADGLWMHRYVAWQAMATVGGAILAYNAVLRLLLPSPKSQPHRAGLLAMAWAHIGLDLLCLTALVVWTGSSQSPFLGLYLLHMVFASLLMPRFMAYLAALLALALLALGWWLQGGWPLDAMDRPLLAGWALTLFVTVYLANHIVSGLRRSHHRLRRRNRRIRRLAAELRRHQQAMLQREKMAALGQMAAGVVHEINNPLASLDSHVQLLERQPQRLGPDALATIRQQLNRIQSIVQRMTEFAHPGGKMADRVAVNDLAHHVAEIARFDPRCKRAALTLNLDPHAGHVHVCRQALEQVMLNLLLNAFDALDGTPDPRVELSTGVRDGWPFLAVADNGPGIDDPTKARLFEPFFTTKPIGKGVGLGLSISYSLVSSLGGKIEVQSAPGRGARFSVLLPADSPAQPA
ncbi:MAG: hypothetical protein IT441_07395 [Phycisphaeraceae bacterium]|nr:hypothetical protein [Phycisphaeraceae bacterium]